MQVRAKVLAARIAEHDERPRQIGTCRSTACVLAVAEPALHGEDRFRAFDRRLIERAPSPESTAARRRTRNALSALSAAAAALRRRSRRTHRCLTGTGGRRRSRILRAEDDAKQRRDTQRKSDRWRLHQMNFTDSSTCRASSVGSASLPKSELTWLPAASNVGEVLTVRVLTLSAL